MISIAVAEGPRQTIVGELKRKLNRAGITVVSAGPDRERADILIAAPGAGQVGTRARVLVAPGEEAVIFARRCEPEMVVTYGMDLRDTITPSSTLHEGGMATVQRELVGLAGGVIVPREIDLTDYQGSLMDKMALSAAMLLIEH